MRLPSGEVELIPATALQRAFECGLVDSRTPVRAFGAHTWTTLDVAAELADASLGSFAPLAMDAPAPDLNDGAIWRSRSDIDPKSFRPRKTPLLGALAAAAVVGVIGFFGLRLPANDLDTHIAAAQAAERAHRAADPAIRVAPAPPPELLHTARRFEQRLSAEQRKRLREADYARRAVTKPGRHKPSASALFANPTNDPMTASTAGADRWDPLNGAL